MNNKLLSHCLIPTDETINQAQRLFHGRGHSYEGLHHITVDWLSPVILITLFSPESTQAIEHFADEILVKIPECTCVMLQHRYKLKGPIDVIRGKEIQQNIVEESDLKYNLQLGKSRNTGLFLDMKNGRDWVQNNSKNKRVLNLFSYTCGFSVAAIAGKAQSVLNVDMSSPALNVGRENHRINDQSLERVKFEKLNILKSFGRLKKRGPFDQLICDPPTLQKGSLNIIKDYPKIMRRLTEFMASESTLMLCLNAPDLKKEFITDNMRKYAPEYRFIEIIKPPRVYKDAQDKGLKVLLFKREG